MGFLDKLKGAVNAVTGGAAKVTLEYEPKEVSAGQTVKVRLTATSTGGELKSKGAFIDLIANEVVVIPKGTTEKLTEELKVEKQVVDTNFQVAPAFVLAAGQTSFCEGTFQVPAGAQPSFNGAFTKLEWQIRGRIEAFGNDPDTGFLPFKVK